MTAVCHDVAALKAAGATIREISQLTGLSRSTVINRLCLKVAKPRKTPEGKQRKCLCCEQTFWSQGPHNRLCNQCRRHSTGPFDTPYAVRV